jgi:hypothetical protein
MLAHSGLSALMVRRTNVGLHGNEEVLELISENFQHGRHYGGVQVIDLFR